MLTPPRIRFTAIALMLGSGALLAQAQSAYTLTVLKSPTASQPLAFFGHDNTWAIDPTDRVVAKAPYFSFFTYSINARAFVPYYGSYVVRWPASTAASVSPAKVYSTSAWLAAASPDGQRLVFGQGRQLYDATARKVLATIPATAGTIEAVNNSGTVVLSSISVAVDPNNPTALGFAGALWSQSGGVRALPSGSYQGAMPAVINAAGMVGGAVVAPDGATSQAALWVKEQLQVLPQAAGTGSGVVALNDSGQMLVWRAPATPCAGDASLTCGYGALTMNLVSSSGESRLTPEGDTRSIIKAVLNNAGVVAGRIQLSGARGEYTEEGRAFLWKAGVLSDLTTLAAAKGAKLPAGSILSDVLAINDKGSIVAVMKDAKKATSIVRLTAKP